MFGQDPTVTAAVVQAGAAIIGLVATITLVIITAVYARDTRRMAKSAEAQIAVMREQMGLEYTPLIEFIPQDPTDHRYEIVNLGKWPVAVQCLNVNFGGYGFLEHITGVIGPGGSYRFRFNDSRFDLESQRLKGEGSAWVDFTYGSTGSKLWRLDGVRFEYHQQRGKILSRGHIRPHPADVQLGSTDL